jgi:hypothetical protein
MRYASKLSQVAPETLLTRLISPSVFSLIGLSQPLPAPESHEADDVLSHTYTGKHGNIVLRNDGIRILIVANYEDRPVMQCALRDRQLDGTNQSSPLTFFPNTDPACNRLPGPDYLAAELSVYSWDPNSYLDGLDVQGTVGHFIADPDFYIWKNFDPTTFFKLWEQAFYLGRAPWQTAKPMSGVPSFFVNASVALLKELGYHRVDAVPSWYNVARFLEKHGFTFTYGEHALAFEGLTEGLTTFTAKGRNGKKGLSSAQQAWIVALQNVLEAYIPEALRLPARWPVTHTNMYWVRMHYDLNPYTGATQHASDLMSGIKSINESATTPKVQVHITSRCPCTDTLGQSSPAASGPAATARDGKGKDEK